MNNVNKYADAARVQLGLTFFEPAFSIVAFALLAGGGAQQGSVGAYIDPATGALVAPNGILGATTISGVQTVSGATPNLVLAPGQANTGKVIVSGKTSGGLVLTTADATAQTLTVSAAAQTSGAATITIPNVAGVNDTFVLCTLAQTLAGKTLTGAGSVIVTNPSGNGLGFGTGAGGAVTQLTNSATGVTLNTPTGQVTTVALSTAAGAEEVFTVTNSQVAATDVVVLSTTYAGAGTIMVATKKVVAGAFDVVITNLHASSALNAAAVLNFAVIKGATS